MVSPHLCNSVLFLKEYYSQTAIFMNYSFSGFVHGTQTPPLAINDLGQDTQNRWFLFGIKPSGQRLHEPS